nr:MAG TPA: hypothetical protein [Bacteriophage sp.]
MTIIFWSKIRISIILPFFIFLFCTSNYLNCFIRSFPSDSFSYLIFIY